MINRVRVLSESGIGLGTKVVDVETGEELRGIESGAIPRFGSNDVVKVELTLGLAALQIDGTPVWMVTHPRSGDLKAVKSITFEDGEVWP